MIKRMKDCCKHDKTARQCKRMSDGKIFKLPRRFTRKKCVNPRGFTMRSSCAPYKDCFQSGGGGGGGRGRGRGRGKRKTRKGTRKKKGARKTKKNKRQFLYNPNDPKKSFDVYIDKNPKDTISIAYTTVKDVCESIQKLEKLYKKGAYSHKRIWQVGMIMKVRLGAMKKHKKKLYPKAKHVNERYNLAYKNIKTCVLDRETKSQVVNYEYSSLPCPYYQSRKIYCAHKRLPEFHADYEGNYGISKRDSYVISEFMLTEHYAPNIGPDNSVFYLKLLFTYLNRENIRNLCMCTKYRMNFLEKYAYVYIPNIVEYFLKHEDSVVISSIKDDSFDYEKYVDTFINKVGLA